MQGRSVILLALRSELRRLGTCDRRIFDELQNNRALCPIPIPRFHSLAHARSLHPKTKKMRTGNDPLMISLNKNRLDLERMNTNLDQTANLSIHIQKCESSHKIECSVFLQRPRRGRETQRLGLKVSALSSELSSGSNGNMFPWMEPFLVDNLYGYWNKTFTLTFDSDSERFALQKSLVEEFATEMGSSIRACSNLMENLSISLHLDPGPELFFQKMCTEIFDDRSRIGSLFPSLRHTHLALRGDLEVELCPKLMRRVRELTIVCPEFQPTEAHHHIAWARAIHEKVRNYDIEELYLRGLSFQCPRLLADVLGGVGSIWIQLMKWDDASVFMDAWELLAKADSANPQQLRIQGNLSLDPRLAEFMTTLLRLRPNLLALTIDGRVLMTKEKYKELFGVISRSRLERLSLTVVMRPLGIADDIGGLLTHSSIRDLELRFDDGYPDSDESSEVEIRNCVCTAVDKITDKIKKTCLLRFRWWLIGGWTDKEDTVLKANKLCDALRENQSLVDVSIEAWSHVSNHFVTIICERNQYTSQVVRKADSIPLGLWPLILASVEDEASLLYHLLTSCPHVVRPSGCRTEVSDRDALFVGAAGCLKRRRVA